MHHLLGNKTHLSVLVVSITAVIALGNRAAWAQGVQRFETYTEALDRVLTLSGRAISFPFGTNCNLTQDPNDIISGRIGPNLSRHCIGAGNISSGSVLGGSLVSLQSTRTVSQFSLRPRQTDRPPPPPRPKEPAKSPFAASDHWIGDAFEGWLFPVESAPPSSAATLLMRLDAIDDFPTGELRTVIDRLSVFATFEHQRVDRAATAFESGFQSDHNKATIGFGYRVTPSILVGASGLYKRTNGDFDEIETKVVTDFGRTVTLPYQQACGQSSGGEFDSDEFGGSVFAIARLGEAGFLFAEIGGAAFDQRYAQSLCMQSNSGSIFFFEEPPSATQLFSGIIKGSPAGQRVEAQLRGGYDFVAGPLLVGPRVGLDFSWTKVDGYSESEVGASGSSTLLGGGLPFPTGAALRYKGQDFTSLQSRLGLIVALPVALNSWIVTPFVEGTYFHEFENGQRDIEARFVEDFRANPTVFSFKTDAPDRNFFELGGGVNTQLGERAEVFVGGKAVLDNSLFDSYSIQAALRLRF